MSICYWFFFRLLRSNSNVERIVATLIASHRAIRLDSVEYNLVLTLVLCRPGKLYFLYNYSKILLQQFGFVYNMVLYSIIRSMRFSWVQKRLDHHRNKRQGRSDETRCVQVTDQILWNIGLHTFRHRRLGGIYKNNFFRTIC